MQRDWQGASKCACYQAISKKQKEASIPLKPYHGRALSPAVLGQPLFYSPINWFQHKSNTQFACSRTFQVCSLLQGGWFLPSRNTSKSNVSGQPMSLFSTHCVSKHTIVRQKCREENHNHAGYSDLKTIKMRREMNNYPQGSACRNAIRVSWGFMEFQPFSRLWPCPDLDVTFTGLRDEQAWGRQEGSSAQHHSVADVVSDFRSLTPSSLF